jgi:hypothetical protein
MMSMVHCRMQGPRRGMLSAGPLLVVVSDIQVRAARFDLRQVRRTPIRLTIDSGLLIAEE